MRAGSPKAARPSSSVRSLPQESARHVREAEADLLVGGKAQVLEPYAGWGDELGPGPVLVLFPAREVEVLVEDDHGADPQRRLKGLEHGPGRGVQVGVQVQEGDVLEGLLQEPGSTWSNQPTTVSAPGTSRI